MKPTVENFCEQILGLHVFVFDRRSFLFAFQCPVCLAQDFQLGTALLPCQFLGFHFYLPLVFSPLALFNFLSSGGCLFRFLALTFLLEGFKVTERSFDISCVFGPRLHLTVLTVSQKLLIRLEAVSFVLSSFEPLRFIKTDLLLEFLSQ